jgi:spectinomycin phosphotransferase
MLEKPEVAAVRWPDGAAGQMAAVLRERRDTLLDLVEWAERLAGQLSADAAEGVLCHADIHAGNVLIDAHERLTIVDWDHPILAPKERDLMYAGGAQFGQARTPEAEERLFYQGYGAAAADARALAYYRYERIIEDIAAFGDAVLLTEDGGADRMQAVEYVRANFLPGGTVGAAYQGDRFSEIKTN